MRATRVLRIYSTKAARVLSHLYAVSPKNARDGSIVCRELVRHGIPTTIGKLSNSQDDVEQIVKEYCSVSDALRAAPERTFRLAVKPPALHFDPLQASRIQSTATANGHGIHIDSHGHDVADQTLDLLETLLVDDRFSSADRAGLKPSLTLPSRWKRSTRDAEWAIERGLRIRLVKGEFPADHQNDEVDSVDGFLSLVERLAGRVPELAIATHDNGLAREAIRRSRNSSSSIQLELLFGFPIRTSVEMANQLHVPVAFYVPYGGTLLLYGIRHLLSNPHKLGRGNYLECLMSLQSRLTKTIQMIEIPGDTSPLRDRAKSGSKNLPVETTDQVK